MTTLTNTNNISIKGGAPMSRVEIKRTYGKLHYEFGKTNQRLSTTGETLYWITINGFLTGSMATAKQILYMYRYLLTPDTSRKYIG